MKQRFSKEVKIGIATICSLALLYVGINFLKGINIFKPTNYYYISCTNAKDVNVSSPVFVEGFKVGLVRAIVYDYNTTDKITIEISLDKGMRINKGSYVAIESTFLSGAELHIKLNKYVSEYIPSGSTLEGRLQTDMMSTVQNELLPQVGELLPRIDSILCGLQAMVNHPALTQSLVHIEQTTSQLELSTKQLNAMLNNDLPVISTHLQTTTQQVAAFTSDLTK